MSATSKTQRQVFNATLVDGNFRVSLLAGKSTTGYGDGIGTFAEFDGPNDLDWADSTQTELLIADKVQPIVT